MFVSAGGWWHIQDFDDITGSVAIETGNMTYIEALDNGLFKAGLSHDIGNCVDYSNVVAPVGLMSYGHYTYTL